MSSFPINNILGRTKSSKVNWVHYQNRWYSLYSCIRKQEVELQLAVYMPGAGSLSFPLVVATGRHCIHSVVLCNRERKSRDLVLAVESTGDLGCFDACVKNRIVVCFWSYSQN